MIMNFYDAFDNENDFNVDIPKEVLDVLNQNLPKNFHYYKDSTLGYVAGPSSDHISLKVTIDPQFVEKELKNIPQKDWAEYIYRAQLKVPVTNTYIGNDNKMIPLEETLHNPLESSAPSLDSAELVPEPFPNPISITFETIEGDSITLHIQRQSCKAMKKRKYANVDFPAIEMRPTLYEDAFPMRTKFNFTVIPANAKSSKDALAALRLLKGLYEGTATIKGEKKSFPKQDISDIDMEDLTNKIALWTDICTLEEKLNVSFDPSAPMPQEDLEFLYQLRACLLCHKKIAWKHPFSKLHLTQTSQNIHEIESLVGKDDISLNFDEGPIPCTLLGTSFELYSKTELRHILITSIDWTDDNKSSADLYIADSSSRSWELLRAFVTTDEYLNNSSRHKLASS